MSIRWWLGGIVLAVALPLLALLTWMFVIQLQREQTDAREVALRIARATALRVEDLHLHSLALLDKIAQRPAIRDYAGGPCDSLFSIVDYFPQYVDLLLTDASGNVRCAAQPQGNDRRLSAAAQQCIVSAFRNRELVQRKPAICTAGTEWVSIVSVPVTNGHLVLVDLPEIVGREVLPPGTVVTIVDRAGTVVARSRDSERWQGRMLRGQQIVALASRQNEGTAEAFGIDGVSRQYGFTHAPELGWTIYVGIPTATVMRPMRRLYLGGVIVVTLIAALVAVAALMLARKIERPLAALVAAADSAARGAYGKVTTTEGPKEITQLGGSFNDMVDSRSDAERRMKSMSDRLLVVQEEERTRIARELHDDLGQSLTALKMDVVGLMNARPPLAGSEAIRDRIVRTLDATTIAVRRISSELRPSVLDDLGLVDAIESEAKLFEERTGIECDLSFPDLPLTIARPVATALYRIVQEALTNVARHSNASRVEVRLRARRNELLLEVRDDGRGITNDEIDAAASLGLIGIRERAAIIGGSVRFEGVAGRGTIVSVRVPLP